MLQRAWHELHLVLLLIWHIKMHSGSGSGFVSKFSLLCNFVNFAHRNMYDAYKQSCAQGLHFFFLHLRALSYLWGRYDQKTKKSSRFCLWLPFLHIESSVIPPLKAFYQGLHFFFLHWWAMNNIWGHYDLKAWKFDDLTVLCAVWFTLSVLRDLFLKPLVDQHLLTSKVNVKVKLESFNCCLQQ